MTRSLKQALGATALALFSSAALAQFVPTEMPKFEPATPLTDKPVIPWQTPPMPDLLCVAESITKTLAICMRCGNPAKHTQRLVDSGDLIVVGASGLYEARCRRCFEPGVPKQETLDFASPPAAEHGRNH